MSKKILTLTMIWAFVMTMSGLALGDTNVVNQYGDNHIVEVTQSYPGNSGNFAQIEQGTGGAPLISTADYQEALIHQRGLNNTAQIFQQNNVAPGNEAEQHQWGTGNGALIMQTGNVHHTYNNTAIQWQIHQNYSTAQIWQTGHSGKNLAEQRQGHGSGSSNGAYIYQQDWSMDNVATQNQYDGEHHSQAYITQSSNSRDNTATQVQTGGSYNVATIQQIGDGTGYFNGTPSYNNTATQDQYGQGNTATILQNTASPSHDNFAEQEQSGHYNTAYVSQTGCHNESTQIQNGNYNVSTVIQNGYSNYVHSTQNGGDTSTITQIGSNNYALVN